MKYRIKYDIVNNMHVGFLYANDELVFMSQEFKTKHEAQMAVSRIMNAPQANNTQIENDIILDEQPTEDVITYETIDKPMFYVQKNNEGMFYGVVYHKVKVFINGLYDNVSEQILYVTTAYETEIQVKAEILNATNNMYIMNKKINTNYNKNTIH